jgi:calcium-dependent protein kinase
MSNVAKTEQKLQQAAMTFIVCQLTTKEEQAELYKSFKAFDKNSDGKITIDELIEGYKEIYKHMSEEEIVAEAKRVFKMADTDGSGELDYSEWQVATINKLDILQENKLKGAFAMFDRVNLRA